MNEESRYAKVHRLAREMRDEVNTKNEKRRTEAAEIQRKWIEIRDKWDDAEEKYGTFN